MYHTKVYSEEKKNGTVEKILSVAITVHLTINLNPIAKISFNRYPGSSSGKVAYAL